jgi:hypothetical protein
MIEEILPWQALPEIYSAQAITGVLFAAPFIVFATIPAIILFKQFFRKNQSQLSSNHSKADSFNWISASLLGSFLLAMICLSMFFWSAMRYAEDFMPALTLLGIIGFWHGYRSLFEDPKKSKTFIIFGITLASISIIVGTLLALSNYITSGLL